MSWGYKVTFLYLGFVVMILTMVVMSIRQDIDLVTENYYEKEQDYMIQVQNSRNSASLEVPLQMDYRAKDRVLQLQFPKGKGFEAIEGIIQFYRPSNADKDFQIDIEADSNHLQSVNMGGLMTGLWKVRVNWSADGRAFFDEKQVVVSPSNQ